jgi:hypothetical protein
MVTYFQWEETSMQRLATLILIAGSLFLAWARHAIAQEGWPSLAPVRATANRGGKAIMAFRFRPSIGLVAGLVALAFFSVSPRAEAASKEFRGRISGTFVSTPFSFDGGSALYCNLFGQSSLGRFTFQGVAEEKPNGHSCTLPGGESGVALKLVGETDAFRFDPSGGLLFDHATSGTFCLNPTTGAVVATEEYTVDGGTGRFTDAGGSFTFTINGGFLAAPTPPGSGDFGFFTAAIEGTVELRE